MRKAEPFDHLMTLDGSNVYTNAALEQHERSRRDETSVVRVDRPLRWARRLYRSGAADAVLRPSYVSSFRRCESVRKNTIFSSNRQSHVSRRASTQSTIDVAADIGRRASVITSQTLEIATTHLFSDAILVGVP